MPTLRFHGVDKDKIVSIAPKLFDSLTAIYSIPDDYLNVEVDNSVWIGRYGEIKGFPMVEVVAFKRSDEIEDGVAVAIDKVLKDAGYAESEVYFIHVEPRSYYSGGEHF